MNVTFKSVPASNESGNYVYEDEGIKLKVELQILIKMLKNFYPLVKKDIDAFVGKAPQFDDITMICLEYKERYNLEKKND